MGQSNDIRNETAEAYDDLLDLVETKLPSILDSGKYPNNSEIIRVCDTILRKKEVFLKIPELAEKSLVTIIGSSKDIYQECRAILRNIPEIKNNSSIPMFIIQDENYESSIQAITASDDTVIISSEEYSYLNEQLYRENIDLRYLVKCYVVHKTGPKSNLIYCILPSYMDARNPYYLTAKTYSRCGIIIPDKMGKCSRNIKNYSIGTLYYLGDLVDAKKFEQCYLRDKQDYKLLCIKKEALNRISEWNNTKCLNYPSTYEFKKILLDVLLYNSSYKNELDDFISKLGEDLVTTEEKIITESVQSQRKKKVAERDELQEFTQQFNSIFHEIIESAERFDRACSSLHLAKIPNKCCADYYIYNVLEVFFKHVLLSDYLGVNDDIIQLQRLNYPFCENLSSYLKWCQTKIISSRNLNDIRNMPQTHFETAKIQIALSDELKIPHDRVIDLIPIIKKISTPKEHLFKGIQLYEQGKYDGCVSYLVYARTHGETEADKYIEELVDLNPATFHSMKLLADSNVPEANLYLSRISKNAEEKEIYLKLAAISGYLPAIKAYADEQYASIHPQFYSNLSQPVNEKKANILLGLYRYIKQHDNQIEYDRRIGYLLYKLQDYTKAYEILKNIPFDEALFLCGDMAQYGHGTSKNLEVAKRYFSRIGRKEANVTKRLQSIESQLEKEKLESATKYQETKSYSSSSHTTYYSDDGCFITTAACKALYEKDDCKELNVLRKFRDEFIRDDGEDGNLLISEYYRIGPTIVRYINSDNDFDSIYDQLWEDYIFPSYALINEGRNQDAKLIYISMVKELCERYHVAVDNTIMEKYGISV